MPTTAEPTTQAEAIEFAVNAAKATVQTPTLKATPEPVEAPSPSAGSEATEVKPEPVTPEAPAEAQPDAGKEAQAPAPPDLSHIPEQYREAFKGLPPEALKWSEKAFLRESDYTRKTMALSEDRKKVEAEKSEMASLRKKAALWERLEQTPAAAEAAHRVLNGESTPSKPAEPEFDPETATPKDWMSFMDRRVKEAVSLAKQETLTEVETRYVAPRTAEQKRTASLVSYAEQNGIAVTDLAEAVKAAQAYHQASGGTSFEKVDPERVVEWVKPFVVKAPPSPAPSGAAVTAPKVAAPGRGGGVIAPQPVPAHVREGRAPKTDVERKAHALYLLRERMGIPLSEADLEAAR